MEKIDVVIVGAGLAGLSCAYRLAESDVQTIVVERGDFPGSKNVTGGRLYLMPIRDMVGDMFDGAPFERKVVRERWSLLGDGNSVNIDLASNRFQRENHSFTLLRATLDRWLSEKLMGKGVFIIPKYRVDDLLWEDGKVAGIRAGGEEIYANIVVAADGVLSFMGEKAGLKGKPAPRNYAVGIKEVIELPEEKINDRFNVASDEGVAHLFLGDVTKGLFGGGFLYTNKESLSLGIVVGIKALMERQPSIETHTLMDLFKDRYEMKRLLEGGRVSEYSAHLIPEAGYGGVSKLYGNGILLVGDAAGFALNMGVTVRGMEFAVASGIIAAETIVQALKKDDCSEASLASYEMRLKETFVLKDLQTFKDIPEYLDKESLFAFYPRCVPELLERLMWFDTSPKARMSTTLWDGMRSLGMVSLKRLKDFYGIRKI